MKNDLRMISVRTWRSLAGEKRDWDRIIEEATVHNMTPIRRRRMCGIITKGLSVNVFGNRAKPNLIICSSPLKCPSINT